MNNHEIKQSWFKEPMKKKQINRKKIRITRRELLAAMAEFKDNGGKIDHYPAMEWKGYKFRPLSEN